MRSKGKYSKKFRVKNLICNFYIDYVYKDIYHDKY